MSNTPLDQIMTTSNVAAQITRGSWSRLEFCKRHDLSLGMFHRLVNARKLRARKIGSRTVVTLEDEALWLSSLPDAA